MKTSSQVAADLGLSLRRIQQACKAFGFEKIGRDYLLTAEQVRMIAACIGKVGRPAK